MKNIELKVKIKNKSDLISALKKNKADKVGVLNQIDTYYKVKKGRLKIREINNKDFELIYYLRPDTKKSRLSEYYVINFSKKECHDLKNILKQTNGELVIVKKSRELWIYKNTRIHIDEVSDLGNYLELETVIKNIDLRNGNIEHEKVVEFLRLDKFTKIDKSYSDLLLKK